MAYQEKLKLYLFTMLIFVGVDGCGVKKSEKEHQGSPSIKESQQTKSTPHPGRLLYIQLCMACHMENGLGVAGLNPPLSGSATVLGARESLITIILQGKEGPLEINGEQFNGVMAKMDYLNNQQVADVLTYVRQSFGNEAAEVLPEDVQKVRESLID